MTAAITVDRDSATALGRKRLDTALFSAQSPIRAHSLEEARDYLGGLLAPHALTLRGRGGALHLKHNVTRIHQLNLHFIAYRSRADEVDVLAPKLESNYLVQFPLSGSAEITQGRDSYTISPGMMLIGEPRKPLTARMSRDYQQLVLQLPVSVLNAAVHRDRPDRSTEMLRFDTDCINRTAAPQILLSTLGTICQAVGAGDGLLTRPAVQRAFQETLVALMLSLPNNLVSDTDDCHAAAPHYVRRAEDYMRAHLTEEIGIEELVRIAGVSRRSLHAGFRRYRDTTPLGLLKAMRLEAARNDLMRAGDGQQRTVTDVATNYGFYHLSKFARDFRESFGQLPSEMLRGAGR